MLGSKNTIITKIKKRNIFYIRECVVYQTVLSKFRLNHFTPRGTPGMTSLELLSLIFASKNQEEDRVERQREENKSQTSPALQSTTPPLSEMLKNVMDVSKFVKFLLKSLSFN